MLHEPFEFDYIGDDIFTIGVPALAPVGFRHAVASAARAWLIEDPVVLAALERYSGVELFQPPKRGYYPLFREIAGAICDTGAFCSIRFCALRSAQNSAGIFVCMEV